MALSRLQKNERQTCVSASFDDYIVLTWEAENIRQSGYSLAAVSSMVCGNRFTRWFDGIPIFPKMVHREA
jgi:hypothetical protein